MRTRSPYPTARLVLTPEAFQRRSRSSSGTPQQTVMWFKYESGDFLFTTLTGRVKFRNYLRDPCGSVAIVDPDDMFRYVIASGTFAVDDRDPVAFYRALGRHYLDDEGRARWQQTAVTESRIVVLAYLLRKCFVSSTTLSR